MRFVGLLFAALLAAAPFARAADQAQLLIGVGQYDIIPDDNKAAAVHAQYRFASGFGAGWLGESFLGVKPLVGGFVNNDEGGMVFAGFALPFQWNNGLFELEPSAAFGFYHRGDSTFLGGTEQFHLGLHATVRVVRGVRAGVGLTHVSNATLLHKKNRGTNILMGTVGFEF